MAVNTNHSVARRRKIVDQLQSYSLLLPNLILFLALSLYPIFWTLRFVFYRYGGYATGDPVFVGLENLQRVFRDEIYWLSVRNTLVYAAGKILFTIPISFVLAVILNQKRKANGLFQSLVFMPTIMSSAVMGLVFYLLFNVYDGQVNRYLLAMGMIDRPVNWLGSDHAMKTLIIVAVWGAIGNYMVYFIAGLQQVTQDALESATIDGAGPLRTLWSITIPMMGPIVKIILMLSITAAFSDMNTVMVLTEGGPTNATMVMALYGYSFFFPVSSGSYTVPQYGYGAAVSAVSAVIAGVITLLYLAAAKKLDDIY